MNVDDGPAPNRFKTGLAILGCVVFLWTSSSFLVNALLQGNDGSQSMYAKPLFITYLNTSTFIFYLLPYKKVKKLFRACKGRTAPGVYVPVEDSDDEEAHRSPLLEEPPPELTTRETARLAAEFCALWFFANWTANASFQYTTVSSSTILQSTSSFFTLFFCAIMGIEDISAAKLGALFMTIFGVSLVSWHGSSSTEGLSMNSIIWGDALALLSAAFYGIYTALLKIRIEDESRLSLPRFFGFVGLFNLSTIWPLLILFHFLRIELWSLPDTKIAWTIVAINAAITFVSDFLWIIAMLMTSPLIVTVGLSLTIPLSLLGEILLQHRYANVLYWVGATCVFSGFVMVSRF